MTSIKIKYPYSKPFIDENDIKAVNQVLEKAYLTQGKKLIDFESKLRKTFKSKYAIACNSGTAALHMIYMALGVNESKGILTTPLTFLATANAAKMCNAPVYFADVDEKTGLMDLDSAEEQLKKNKKISFISLVHLGGRLGNLEEYSTLAKKYNCLIIEDACHAPGSSYVSKSGNNYITGDCSYSIACSFSFHAIKHVSIGEGGCITTNSRRLFEKVKLIRNHGMYKKSNKSNNKWEYKMSEIGWNYRLDEMSCALGISQLSKLRAGIIKRRKLAKIYHSVLENYDFINCPSFPKVNSSHSWHLYSISIDFKKIKKNKIEVMRKLEKFGIGTQIHYKPLTLQPYYRNKNLKALEKAMRYYKKTLSLPLYYELDEHDIKYICKYLIKVLV